MYQKQKDMTIETQKFRAELTDNYFFIRSLQGNNDGAWDTMVPEKKHSKVKEVLNNVNDKTSSEVLSELFQIKGLKFDYRID